VDFTVNNLIDYAQAAKNLESLEDLQEYTNELAYAAIDLTPEEISKVLDEFYVQCPLGEYSGFHTALNGSMMEIVGEEKWGKAIAVGLKNTLQELIEALQEG